MIVDVFKDNTQFFQKLQGYNSVIKEVCKKVTFNSESEEYDLPRNRVSRWFDPNYLRYLYFPKYYPHQTKDTHDPKFNLVLFFPNYITLYLVNLFYQEKKHVLIEDMACGMGRLVFYLTKLGFTNFSLTENFSQLSKFLFDEMMKAGKVNYVLNDSTTNPIVLNIVSWTAMTRTDFPSSTEVFFAYNDVGKLVEKIDGKFHVKVPSGTNIEMKDFVFLCNDVDELMRVYCRKDKYDEFKTRMTHTPIVLP